MGSKVERGPTGRRVAANVRRLRDERHWSLEALATELRKAGRPMLPTTISKLEQLERRVDVDDLVALAEALDVEAEELLFAGEPTSGVSSFEGAQALIYFARGLRDERPLDIGPEELEQLREAAERRGYDHNRPGFWKRLAAANRGVTPRELLERWQREDAGEEAGRG